MKSAPADWMSGQFYAIACSRLALCCLLISFTQAQGFSQEVPPLPPFDVDEVQNPVAPGDRGANANQDQGVKAGLASDPRVAELFGDITQLDQLPTDRRVRAHSPAADAVFSPEATGRKTADIGDLLKQSKSAHGVDVQRRTPIVTDTRIRGQRVGQVLASGSYWAPARMDLDTMMNKIDSRLIENAILVKGPYATRYGPGFRFVDIDFIHSPRYERGTEMHGLSSATFNSNGEQWYGRQSAWGGSEDYGFHISYGHRTGNDYQTGDNGFTLPTSYKSRDLFTAFGIDLSDHETLEFNVLRLDQTDVEFPGLVFDLNFLVTDGYEVTYTDTRPFLGDEFTAEVWYNRTRFEGDTLRPGKNGQIPTLVFDLESVSGFDGFAVTDGDALSGGYRFENAFEYTTFTGFDGRLALGTDLIVLNQELNDVEPESADPNDNNFPLPRSHSVDVGVYLEDIEQVNERLKMTAGLRMDGVIADAVDSVDGVPDSMTVSLDSELEQDFLLGSAYLTAEYSVSPGWTVDLGFGTAHRAPTLTELYTLSSFIGSLQRGVTFLVGDPQLKSEKLYQIDVGAEFRGEDVRFGIYGHHAWIHDYITYDLFAAAGGADGLPQGAAFVNTDLATLAGFESFAQADLTRSLSVFSIVSFVEGRDHSRNTPSRQSGLATRSNVDKDEEALPGIAPLEARVGVLLQDPSPERRWGLEFLARIVDNQDRVATSLEESATPGFTTYDVRSYVRKGPWLWTAGIENLTDKFYREHIDYRSGLGVFRPGIGFYCGAQVNY